MYANGPAIKCRLCWFGHGGCEQKCLIGVKSWYTAVMNKPWRTFCQSRYKVIWGLRVSRYKVCGEQVTSQGIESFIGSNGAVAV